MNAGAGEAFAYAIVLDHNARIADEGPPAPSFRVAMVMLEIGLHPKVVVLGAPNGPIPTGTVIFKFFSG